MFLKTFFVSLKLFDTNMSVSKTEVQDSKREHEPFTTNPAKFSDERICCSAYSFMQFVIFVF